MNAEIARWLCTFCGAIVARDAVSMTQHPFIPHATIAGCPERQQI